MSTMLQYLLETSKYECRFNSIQFFIPDTAVTDLRYNYVTGKLLIPMVVSNTIILSGSYLGVGCGMAPWRLSTAELPLNPPRLRGRVREEGSISPVLLMTLQALLAI